MDENFSTAAINAIRYSQQEALRLGYASIGTEHIALGILRQGNRTVLDLLRDNMQEFSRLVNRVNLRAVPGKSRMPVMGRMPEAVWTEACASPHPARKSCPRRWISIRKPPAP